MSRPTWKDFLLVSCPTLLDCTLFLFFDICILFSLSFFWAGENPSLWCAIWPICIPRGGGVGVLEAFPFQGVAFLQRSATCSQPASQPRSDGWYAKYFVAVCTTVFSALPVYIPTTP